jgi:phage regulator Rha-like protein
MNNLPTPSASKAPIPGTIPAICQGVPFMTSLAIAEMTGKQHGHVMRDIERELDKIGEPQSKFGAGYLDAQGQRRPCYSLPGKYLLFIASAYDAKLRMQIIEHWEALNNGTAAPVADAANVFVGRLISGGIEGRRLAYQQDMQRVQGISDPKARRMALSLAGKP